MGSTFLEKPFTRKGLLIEPFIQRALSLAIQNGFSIKIHTARPTMFDWSALTTKSAASHLVRQQRPLNRFGNRLEQKREITVSAT
jgi:hypothetical protein